jgi:hypothetical protein
VNHLKTKLNMLFSTQAAVSPRSHQPRLTSQRRAALAVQRLTLFALSLLMLISFVALLAPRTRAQQKQTQPAPQYFTGEVDYKVSAGGSNEEGLAAFKLFSPTAIKIIYGREGFRIIETGGMENNVLLNYARGAAYLLDAGAKTATKVGVMNLDDEDGAKLASIMPYHYRTDMQPTGKTENVAGQSCREYKVLKSAFIREGATASICVAEAIRFKPSRYSFQNESKRADSPLPLSLPVPAGAILKLEVNESGVSVTYEAVKITPGTPAAAVFSVPAGYKIKSDK